MRSNKSGDTPMRSFRLRILSFSAVAALALSPALWPASAAETNAAPAPAAPVAQAPAAQPAASAATGEQAPLVTGALGPTRMRYLSLGVGKSAVVDLPREAKDVLVADPKIANAVIRSSQRAYIIGSAVGQTNVIFFDADGNQITSYDIAVKRDLNGIRAALRGMPGVQVEGVGDGVILTGSVSSPIEAQQAGDVATKLVGAAEKVVNSIVVRGRDQVMLKVHVAEVRRDIIKQMGVDISASMNYGTAVVNFNNQNPFTAFGRPLVADNGFQGASILKGVPQVRPPCARWRAPAWCARWPSRTSPRSLVNPRPSSPAASSQFLPVTRAIPLRISARLKSRTRSSASP